MSRPALSPLQSEGPLEREPALAPAIEVEDLPHRITVVALRGEHDFSSRPRLAEILGRALRRGSVVVDLGACTFLDSTVIATLLSATQHAKAVGVLGLSVPPEARIVSRITSLMRISAFVPIYPSLDAAVASIRDEQ